MSMDSIVTLAHHPYWWSFHTFACLMCKFGKAMDILRVYLLPPLVVDHSEEAQNSTLFFIVSTSTTVHRMIHIS